MVISYNICWSTLYPCQNVISWPRGGPHDEDSAAVDSIPGEGVNMAGKIPQDMEVAGKSIELNGVQFRCPIVGWLGCKPLTILTVTTFAGCISQTFFSMIHPHSSWMTQAVSPVPIPNAIRHVHRNHTGSRGLLLRCLNWPFLNTPSSYPLGNQALINGWWLEPPKKRHGIHGLHWLH